ncbi:hypothetical protein [Ferruginibacter sp. SUN106]|uniref:hypothetical protein n=1 Tax=Ferruginibacter sp. SUN106 TaxID=2978348 RepID=UPI003D36C570
MFYAVFIRIMVVSFLSVSVCIGSFYKSKPGYSNTGKPGQQFIYSYSSEGTGYSDIQMLYNTDSAVKAQPFFFRPSVQTIRVDIQCNIKKTILRSAGDGMQVCFEIILPKVKIENGALPVDADMMLKEMTIPVFADMTMAGNILSVKTDTAVSYLTAGIVKNILSNTQAILLHGENKSWQVTEENTVGLFKANYEVVHQGKDSVEYTKKNIGYEKIKSAKKGQKLLPDSKTTIVADASGTVRRIHTSESLVTLFGADTIVASGSTMEYKLLSVSTVGQRIISAFAQLEHSGKYQAPVALSDPVSDEEINRLAYKNTLDGDNFATLMAKLGVMKFHDKEYENDLVKKFRALAWLSEKDCIKMTVVLRNAAVGSEVFRVISHALAAVETSFSIDQLAAVVAERANDEAVMTELLPVLATTSTPTSKAADIIKELAFSQTRNPFIITTAQLTLGGMVKNLRSIDKQKADELTDVIVEHMRNSTDTMQQLLVYGNTGAYRLLPIISSYISDPLASVEIRKAAVFAMRLIDNKEVTLLLGKLSVDKDTVISKTANETIEFRSQYLNRNL